MPLDYRTFEEQANDVIRLRDEVKRACLEVYYDFQTDKSFAG
jgi:hypothetical protein